MGSLKITKILLLLPLIEPGTKNIISQQRKQKIVESSEIQADIEKVLKEKKHQPFSF